jgi:hypothetical protein
LIRLNDLVRWPNRGADSTDRILHREFGYPEIENPSGELNRGQSQCFAFGTPLVPVEPGRTNVSAVWVRDRKIESTKIGVSDVALDMRATKFAREQVE